VAKHKAVKKAENSSQPKPASKKAVEKKGRFTIQIAASKNIKSAERLVATLRKKGFQAYQIRAEVAGKGVWYRVRVGAFEDRRAAKKFLEKLKASRYGGMVVSIQ
jgi:cell division septation protein DedD